MIHETTFDSFTRTLRINVTDEKLKTTEIGGWNDHGRDERRERAIFPASETVQELYNRHRTLLYCVAIPPHRAPRDIL